MADKSASVDELVLICIHVHGNCKQLSARVYVFIPLEPPLPSCFRSVDHTINIRSRCAPSLVAMYCSAVTMHQQHVSHACVQTWHAIVSAFRIEE